MTSESLTTFCDGPTNLKNPEDNNENVTEEEEEEEGDFTENSSLLNQKENDVSHETVKRLETELKKAQTDLKERDEELTRLNRIRSDVEKELEELTASLFQEAHKMVKEANIHRAAAEKALKESLMQIEVLTAEVLALKELVVKLKTMKILHESQEQLIETDNSVRSTKCNTLSSNVVLFDTKEFDTLRFKDSQLEVDPVLHTEILEWKEIPCIDKESPFIARIYKEDIDPCLEFSNKSLSQNVKVAIEKGEIYIECARDKDKSDVCNKCTLLETCRPCHYRFRIGENIDWFYISKMCRNRIIAVCELLNYLKYIERGLVKSSMHDIYWEIIKLRKAIQLARLGLVLPN